MHKHDWIIGLLSAIEDYCHSNKLVTVAAAMSEAISIAAEVVDKTEASGNILYISDYLEKGTLNDQGRIVSAFSEHIEEILQMD